MQSITAQPIAPSSVAPASVAAQVAQTAQLMFERRLTDMAGGNVSARDGALLYITARYSGSKRHWQLTEEDVVCGAIDNDDVQANPRFSREGKAHLAIYRAFPDAGAVIHAHSFHILPFCAAGRAIEPVLEQTEKFGVIPALPYAPAHSDELAQAIVEGLRPQEARIRKQAAAVIMSRHGIILAAKDLLAAIDALERIDWNCHCLLAQAAFASLSPLEVHA